MVLSLGVRLLWEKNISPLSHLVTGNMEIIMLMYQAPGRIILLNVVTVKPECLCIDYQLVHNKFPHIYQLKTTPAYSLTVLEVRGLNQLG